ncbi:MAG: tetratricopeptide repeat protein [Aliidongia sp.]
MTGRCCSGRSTFPRSWPRGPAISRRQSKAWTEAAQLGRTLTSPPLIPERDLAASIHGLARIHAMQQRWPAAADLLEEAVKLLEHDEAAIGSGELIDALNLLATAHSFMARPAQAGATAARAAELASRRAERGGANERIHAAHVLNNMARISLEAGRVDEAHAALSKCVVECQALLDHGANPMLRNLLAASLNRLGHCCLKLGRLDEAKGHLDASVTIMRDLVEREGHAEMAEDLATAVADLERIKGNAPRF